MTTITSAPTTSDEYRKLPDGGPRFQLIEGDLEMSPAPSWYHQSIVLRLSYRIESFLEGHGLGRQAISPIDVYLTPTNVFQPDLLFIARKNEAIIKSDGVHGAPDLIVEVLSPSNRDIDLGSKKRVYARCGVLEFWAVDPETKRVQVFDLRREVDVPRETLRENDQLTTELLPGLQLSLREVFAGAIE